MYDQHDTQLLDLLAKRVGIAAEYHDIQGACHVASAETKRGILSAMGFSVDSGEALARELTRLDETPWSRSCDPVTVIQRGTGDAHWSFRLPSEGAEEQKLRIIWELRDETGAVIHQEETGPGLKPQDVKYVAGNRYVQFAIPIPASLEPGYYDIVASAKGGRSPADGSLRLIVAPPHSHVPHAFLQGGNI